MVEKEERGGGRGGVGGGKIQEKLVCWFSCLKESVIWRMYVCLSLYVCVRDREREI